MTKKIFLLLSLFCTMTFTGAFASDIMPDDDDVITAPKSINEYKKVEEEKTQRNFLKQTLDESDIRAVTNLQVQTGLSNMHGEFVRLRANIGSRGKRSESFVLYGGVGKDWVFDIKNSDFLEDPFTGKTKRTIEWHAGLGIMETMKHSSLSILLDYSQSSCIHKNIFCLNEHFEYSYFFLKNRLGAFASAGVSMYDYKDYYDDTKIHFRVKFAFSVGLTYRFF